MSVCLSLMLALQENLRQLCVFQLANESGQSYRWWEYVTKFGEECTMSGNNYNEDCAERVCQFCNACDTIKLGQPKSVVNVVPTVVQYFLGTFGTHSALRLFMWSCHASLQWQPLLCTHPDCSLSVLVCVSLLSVQRKEFKTWTTIASLLAFHHTVNKLSARFTQVFSELNGDSWSSLPALRNCIGNIQEDRENSIMEAEMASQRGDADTGEVRYSVIDLNHLPHYQMVQD